MKQRGCCATEGAAAALFLGAMTLPVNDRIMAGYPVQRRANASTAMLMARNVHTSTRTPARPVSAATAS
jgi:hypothetical protein